VKIKISRQHIYLSIVSLVLLIFVFMFAFMVLIPEGKSYREKRLELKKVSKVLKKYENLMDETKAKYKDLQNKNRHIIEALAKPFNPQRFIQESKKYFTNLSLSNTTRLKDEQGFAIYEVNTTSKINSPKNFYNFLDAINKGDWIIKINFPITFKSDGEVIKSSFTMVVYENNKDSNSTASTSK